MTSSQVKSRMVKGFSLIEAVISIVILASSFLGLVHVLSNTTTQNIDIDISTTAVLLAQETMAEEKASAFSGVTSIETTSFGGDFANYFYNVDVRYVNPGNLDQIVAGPTSYKRIVVTVTMTGWPGSIVLYDLKTDV